MLPELKYLFEHFIIPQLAHPGFFFLLFLMGNISGQLHLRYWKLYSSLWGIWEDVPGGVMLQLIS